MPDGLDINYSLNNYEDSSIECFNDSVKKEDPALFDQVKSVVKGTILDNSKKISSDSDNEIKSRFFSLKGSLNSKLKNIFHKIGKSHVEEFSEEHLEKEESKEKENELGENKNISLEPSIEEGSSKDETTKDLEKTEDKLEKKRNEVEIKQKRIFSKEELDEIKEKVPEIEKDLGEKDSIKEKQENEYEHELVSFDANKGESLKEDVFLQEKNEDRNILEKNDFLETNKEKKEVESQKDSFKNEDIKKEENELENKENKEEIREEKQLLEGSEGDSISEIEQIEIQKEEKKEEHEEKEEEKEIERKEEESMLLPRIEEVSDVVHDKEEYEEKDNDNSKEKKKEVLHVPLELITFIRKNLSQILAHKTYLIDTYNCVFFAEDTAVFSLDRFRDILITIFRSSVSSIEAEKIYQTRLKAKKFIQDNNLFLLQVSPSKLLIVNSDYGPVKILLENKLTSGFVFSDLVGHANYKNHKCNVKEAFKQFTLFMCDFGFNSGFRYKVKILPNKINSSIALYCSYSVSLVNNFKLFKETISILDKEDFDVVFDLIKIKLDKNKSNQILNYWRLKQRN